ncbi:MAG: hypothetical protein IKC69_06840 [Clostridia bacterium]|nr:hypothetical protein [Clostridia bacterium]
MKKVAKVFIIIGMIVGFWYVLPLIFGIIALKKMKTEKPSVGLSVCVLIFCSLLGGIFLLCSKDEEYGEPAPAPAPAPAAEEVEL